MRLASLKTSAEEGLKVMELEQSIWFNPQTASRKLRSLKPVFERLKEVHQHFIEFGDGDCPYWYPERSHTGLFATAVYECGGVALEEYSDYKMKERKRIKGRVDLWLKLKTEFRCEAKCVRLNLGGDTRAMAAKASKGLTGAIRDLKNHPDPHGLALCFLTPHIHQSKLSTADTKLAEFKKVLAPESCCDALIWIGFSKGEGIPSGKTRWHGMFLAVVEK